LPAKIIVTSVEGGSRISLLGSSGKELLGSVVFKEPRAKGATLRALKGLLGETSVDDRTIRSPQRTAPVKASKAAAPAAKAPVDTPEKVAAPTRRKAASKKVAAPTLSVVEAPAAVTPKKRTAKVTAAKKASATKTAAAKASAKESAPKVAAARKSTKAATARP
jgi:hypothetical protein